MSTSGITTNSATFDWGAVSGAISYAVQYRQTGSSTWTTGSSVSNSFSANSLGAGTSYEWQVQTVCSGGNSSMSASTIFTTLVPPCSTPTGLTTSGVTTSAAVFNWSAVSGAINYNVHYRPTGSSTWTTITTAAISFSAGSLLPGTGYEWQVQTNCTGGTSSFTASAVFTTGSLCTDNYEPNNTKQTAALLPIGVDLTAMIGTATDLDYFRFNNTSAQSRIKIILTNLPADYDVRLYNNNNNNDVASSLNRGTTSETIIYNTTTVGTWRIKVNGYNSAFNANQCYTIRIELSNTPFTMPMVRAMEPEAVVPVLTLYPNPVRDRFTVNFNSENSSMAGISVYNMVGEKVRFQESEVAEGENTMEFATGDLINGIYIFELVNNGQIIRQRFMISK